jgi:hypothetical protein
LPYGAYYNFCEMLNQENPGCQEFKKYLKKREKKLHKRLKNAINDLLKNTDTDKLCKTTKETLEEYLNLIK